MKFPKVEIIYSSIIKWKEKPYFGKILQIQFKSLPTKVKDIIKSTSYVDENMIVYFYNPKKEMYMIHIPLEGDILCDIHTKN